MLVCDRDLTREGLPRWSDLERELLRPTERLSLAEWAEQRRYVTEGPLVGASGQPVRWSNETFPLQRAIMDAIDDPTYSRVVVMGPPQAGGKTDAAAVNTILRAVDHHHRDAMYLSANFAKARDQWVKKIRPAIMQSPRLARLISEDREETGQRERRDFSNGCSLFLAGSESIANISSSTIPVIICDDVQAMPRAIGVHGHPVDVASHRADAMPEEDRTIVLLGTAGTSDDYLARSLAASTHFRPYLPCPSCGRLQLLDWDRMEFDSHDPLAAAENAALRCANEECARRIRDEDLPVMLRGVRWLGRGQEIGPDGAIVGDPPRSRSAGFWWNALYWPFTSWGAAAAHWITGRGDPDKEKDFQQHTLVIPIAPVEEDDAAITVAQLVDHARPTCRKGIIPAAADRVTLTVDVHDRFLYYIVRAWRAGDGASWLVDAGTLGVHGPTKEELLPEAQETARLGMAIRRALEDLWSMEQLGWPRDCGLRIGDCGLKERGSNAGTGELVRASVCLIDGGYRPDAVGQFCMLRNVGRTIWHMVLGRSGARQPRAVWPQQPLRNKRGHVYREINVDESKHVLRELMAVPRDQPGAWTLYDDAPLEAYHRHMISEHFVTKRRGGRELTVWEKRPGGGPNHWWDCEVYAVAAALACGVSLPSMQAVREVSVKNWFERTRQSGRSRRGGR